MNSKFDTSIETLRKLLDQQYQWPAAYPFRFVMPLESVEEFSKLFPQEKIETRFSKNAKYVAVHFDSMINNTQEVIDIYHKVKSVKGVISL